MLQCKVYIFFVWLITSGVPAINWRHHDSNHAGNSFREMSVLHQNRSIATTHNVEIHSQVIDLDQRQTEKNVLPYYKRRRHKHKRQAQLYEIELLMVVDYSIYQHHYQQTKHLLDEERTRVAMTTITDRYKHVLDGIQARFRNIKGYGYFTNDASPWTELSKSKHAQPIVSSDSLRMLADWLNNKSKVTGSFDHAMAFTRYNLAHEDNMKTLGLGYKQSMCTNRSVSIIEDHGNLAYVSYKAAHELAHSLGAKHDGLPATVRYNGRTTTCSTDDGYIMSPKTSSEPDNNLVNHYRSWQFSQCSMLYFNFYIDHLQQNNNNCLLYRRNNMIISQGNHYYGPDVSMATDIYNPDAQCRAVVEQRSVMLRSLVHSNYSDVCRSIPCLDTSNQKSYIPILAIEGTRCGWGQACHSGRCLQDDLNNSKTDDVSEECSFGDQPGLIGHTRMTCDELIGSRDNAYLCYTHDRDCCQTCVQLKRLHPSLLNCTFGDRKTNCKETDCQTSDLCCEYCAIWNNKLADCPTLTPPQNGKIFSNSGSFHHGTTVTYTCNTGYSLDGSGSRTCLENGTWSGRESTCFRGCKKPHKGRYVDIDPEHDQYTITSVVDIACQHRLQLKGNNTASCLHNLSWSSDAAECKLDFTTPPVINVQENTNPGSIVHRFATGDARSEFKLLSYSKPGFKVISGQLVIKPDATIDYEETQMYILFIEAKSVIDQRLQAIQRLTIHIEDINEYGPVFTSGVYQVNVNGSFKNDDILLTLNATDKDGFNASVAYDIVDSTDNTNEFRLGENTGILQLSEGSKMDASVPKKFTLHVQAVDTGLPSRTGYTIVEICVALQCGRNLAPFVSQRIVYMLTMFLLLM